MKRFIVLLALMSVMFAMSPSTAMADHSEQSVVAATVTPAVVSVSAAPNLVYGSVPLHTLGKLPTPLFFVATNTGNVNADFLIKGGDSTQGGTPWSIGSTAALDTFVHKASVTSGFTATIVLTESNQSFGDPLALNITAGTGTLNVWLKLDTPTSTTVNDEQSLPVTIVATVAT